MGHKRRKHKKKAKSGRSKPVSLNPLDLDQAVKGLLAVDPEKNPTPDDADEKRESKE